jgi:outer membrane scaffolding protein for murein synthesis (MipA/OmpV family)
MVRVMSIRVVLAAAAASCTAAIAADEPLGPTAAAATVNRPLPPDWSVTVGGGALAVPSYPGAASSKVLPLPLVDVRYRDVVFLNPVHGIGVNLVREPRLRLGVAVLPDFGRSASGGDRLRGWGNVGIGANAKVFAAYDLGPFAMVGDVRRELGSGDGLLANAGLTTTMPLMRRFILSATATVGWADARYAQSYFGVDAGQSARAFAFGSALPTFRGTAGLHDAALGLVGVLPIDLRWALQSIVRTEVLLGSAAESPLTERRLQLTFGGFLTYRL